MEKSSSKKIHHIVKVRQMLRRWQRRSTSSRRFIASDVPAGHVAICVGIHSKRFLVRATYLNHPIFQKLLIEGEEEYGFTNTGPLTIPCEESEYEEILRFVSKTKLDKSNRCVNLDDFQRCCHVDYAGAESNPLLHGSVFKKIYSEFGTH